MSLTLQIDRALNRPIYQQIVSQIKHQISVGNLPSGTRLPPVRQLAAELGVTRLTVHNAYSELQAAGWVESTVGRGTYVLAGVAAEEMVACHLERHQNNRYYSADMHEITHIGTLHALAYAVPDMNLIPGEELIGIINTLRPNAGEMFSYGEQMGDSMLRVEIAKLLAERDIDAMPDDILITTGATQGLALVAQTMVQANDYVLVEQPTYLGQLKIFDVLGVKTLGVPMDEEGPRLDILERLIIDYQPRFFSTIPNFHNPTGRVMSMSRRKDLLALAYKYQLPILEDDIFALLSYDGPPPPTLKAMDTHNLVITISGFSKFLSPGIRVGYLVAPQPWFQRMVNLKWAMELSGIPIIQRALAQYLREGRLKGHLRRILPIYRERRNTLMQALKHHMPAGTTWTYPQGGFCTFVRLPDGGNYADLYPLTLQRGVAFTPNEAFFSDPDSGYHLRFCFANHPPAIIDEAVAVVANLVRERIPAKTLAYHY